MSASLEKGQADWIQFKSKKRAGIIYQIHSLGGLGDLGNQRGGHCCGQRPRLLRIKLVTSRFGLNEAKATIGVHKMEYVQVKKS